MTKAADCLSESLAVNVLLEIRDDRGPPDLIAGESFAIGFLNKHARLEIVSVEASGATVKLQGSSNSWRALRLSESPPEASKSKMPTSYWRVVEEVERAP